VLIGVRKAVFVLFAGHQYGPFAGFHGNGSSVGAQGAWHSSPFSHTCILMGKLIIISCICLFTRFASGKCLDVSLACACVSNV
jgi:hypothetical protein